MPLTITKEWQAKLGGDTNLEIFKISVAPDDSWLAAGEALAVTGVERVDSLWLVGGSGAANKYSFEWDAAAQKLLAFRTDQVDDPQEAVPDATDLSALTALKFVGIGQ